MAKEIKTTTEQTDSKKTKKPTAKKADIAKKSVTKKPAVKKAAAKKPAAKKPAAKKPEVTETVENTAAASSAEYTATQETFTSTNDNESENVFPGLAKDRDWQSFVLRVAYIITFGVLGWLAFGAAITMTVIQVIITILLGAPNETLQSWVSTIGKYLAEVFEYVSWNTDDKPFPLGRPVPLED